jgi:hypothetical protein
LARSKSTARAEARRRYRAAQAAEQAEADAAADDENGSGSSADGTADRPSGLRGLFTVKPPDWRADLASLPELVRTQRSLWLAVGAVVLGTVVGVGVPRVTGVIDPLVVILVQLVLYVPSIPLLLAGYFAPRAAWLEGVILGALSLVGFLLVNLVGFAGLGSTTGATPATSVTAGDVLINVVALIVQWVVFGGLFGALAAWYRQWLRRSNENARRAREERARDKRRQNKAQTRAR